MVKYNHQKKRSINTNKGSLFQKKCKRKLKQIRSEVGGRSNGMRRFLSKTK